MNCCSCEQWYRNEFESGGGWAPVQSKSGGTDPSEKKLFGRAHPLFGSKSTINRFGERFRDGQYSLVSLFFCCSSTHGAPVPSHL